MTTPAKPERRRNCDGAQDSGISGAVHSIDQLAAESRFIAEAFEICQPVGLGPATN